MTTSPRSRRPQLPVLERRLNDSITAVAAMITGAWEQAGRPAVAGRAAANSTPHSSSYKQ